MFKIYQQSFQLLGTLTSLLRVRFFPAGSPSPHSTLDSSKSTGEHRNQDKLNKTVLYRKSHPDSLVGQPGRFQVVSLSLVTTIVSTFKYTMPQGLFDRKYFKGDFV